MLHNEKDYHQGKTRLVFAGQESLNGYQQMAVRYEKNANCFTKIMERPRCLEIRLPDRTLYITSRTSQATVLLPFPVDSIVSTRRDMNHWDTLDTDMLLFNPIHSPAALNTRPYREAGIEILVDSGGFQLAQGTEDFVDPDANVVFYNKHATIGAGLDFPSPPHIDALLYKKNCKLQALNNARIRSQLKPHVTLAPVVHGGVLHTRQHCLDSVYEQGRDSALLIAGMITGRADGWDVLRQRLECLMLVLDQTRKHVIYYHLLGATSVLWHAINALLAGTGYVNSIGGDSVSHRQQAIGGSYQLYPHFEGSFTWTQPVHSELSAGLPCPCPVCRMAGDARILRDFRISELHHTYVSASIKQVIQRNVNAYIKGTIKRKELWDSILGPKDVSMRVTYNAAFDYLEAVIAKGFKAVPTKSGHSSKSKKSAAVVGTNLFSNATSPKLQAQLDRYAKIHAVYEKYHKTKL